MSPISPYGWVNGGPPAITAANLEAMHAAAGAYTDASITGLSGAATAGMMPIATGSSGGVVWGYVRLVYAGGQYPARPAAAVSVEWIGPTDPGVAAVDGDTWINTS